MFTLSPPSLPFHIFNLITSKVNTNLQFSKYRENFHRISLTFRKVGTTEFRWCLWISEGSPCGLPSWLGQFSFPPTVYCDMFAFTCSPTCVSCDYLMAAILTDKMCFHCLWFRGVIREVLACATVSAVSSLCFCLATWWCPGSGLDQCSPVSWFWIRCKSGILSHSSECRNPIFSALRMPLSCLQEWF